MKAGAAHIAFSAPSRAAVRNFYAAALTAGGRPHGSPALRNDETGCFNAAVLDFDSNSIEVVHNEAPGPTADDARSVASRSRVLNWQHYVAESLGDSHSVVSASTLKPATAVAIGQARSVASAVARPPTARSVSTPVVATHNRRSDDSAKRLVGTLLGAAAGAAVAYAMCKGDEQSKRRPHENATPRSIKAESVYSQYRDVGPAAIDAAPSQRAIEASPAYSAVDMQSCRQPSYKTVVSVAQKAVEYIPAATAAASAVLSRPSASRSISYPSIPDGQRGAVSAVSCQRPAAAKTYSYVPSAAGVPLPVSRHSSAYSATPSQPRSAYHSAHNSTAPHSYVSAHSHMHPPLSAAALARSAASRTGSHAPSLTLGRDLRQPVTAFSLVDIRNGNEDAEDDSDTVVPDDSISSVGSRARSPRHSSNGHESKTPSAAPSSYHSKHSRHSKHSHKSHRSSRRGSDEGVEYVEDVEDARRAPLPPPSEAGSSKSHRRRRSESGKEGRKERSERKGGGGGSVMSLPVRAITESMVGGRRSGRSVATYEG